MIHYFDASTLAMLVFLDDGWETLARHIDDERSVAVFSDFGWGELISAISLRFRRGLLTRRQADALVDRAGDFLGTWAKRDCQSSDLILAAELVGRFELGLKFPDAIHVAIAGNTGCTLATADRRQTLAARASGVSVFNPLEEQR